MNENNLTKHNNFLDILKGICITVVIFTHYGWTDAWRLKLLFPFWVDMAIPVFMIISGFVYAKSFERKQIGSFSDAYSPKNIFSKLVRYTVPYAIAFVIEMIAFALLDKPMPSVNPVALFLNGGEGAGSYYYPVIMQFVFLFPVIYFIVRKYRFKGVLACGIINAAYELLKWAYSMNAACYRLLVFRYILLIAFGCYMALNKLRLNKWYIASALFGVLYIVLVKYTGYTTKVITLWQGTSFVAALYIIPIVALLFKLCHKFMCKPVEMVGKASYHIFLTQMLYYYFATDFVYNYVSSGYMRLAVNIALCIAVGLVFYAVENNITKSILKRLNV